jgi:hypothetical protein
MENQMMKKTETEDSRTDSFSDTKQGVQWLVSEITLVNTDARKRYSSCFDDVFVDFIFQGPDKSQLKVPAFWDGGNVWKVRFSLPKTGIWTYQSICSDITNADLHGKTGKIKIEKYRGKLEIYRRGFVKVSENGRYFIYADGTPFFYLGDTHWSMPGEELDSSNPSEKAQFQCIVDRRVQQGFTVYQSEPLGAKYKLSDGFHEEDIEGFRDLDRRFACVAEAGLVHANAQLFFAGELVASFEKYPDAYLEKLSRYWVARYSAYPVLWTTAQEADNDFYYKRPIYGHEVFDAKTNPWKKVAAWVHSYDPHKHPLTGHMEYASTTDPNGTIASTSSFGDIPGHNWFAAQWSPGKSAQFDFGVAKDFWNSKKLTVNYEGSYDHLWTKEFGARAQGWLAYLNGMFGHGYGAIDIWFYNSRYDIDKPTERDGEIISVEDKLKKWPESLEFPSAHQMGYMKKFFSKIEWWKLTPRFDDPQWFEPTGSLYCFASIEDEVRVLYLYNKTCDTGIFRNMSGRSYTLQWFNPRKNTYGRKITVTAQDGAFNIGKKPDKKDWVLLFRKEG